MKHFPSRPSLLPRFLPIFLSTILFYTVDLSAYSSPPLRERAASYLPAALDESSTSENRYRRFPSHTSYQFKAYLRFMDLPAYLRDRPLGSYLLKRRDFSEHRNRSAGITISTPIGALPLYFRSISAGWSHEDLYLNEESIASEGSPVNEQVFNEGVASIQVGGGWYLPLENKIFDNNIFFDCNADITATGPRRGNTLLGGSLYALWPMSFYPGHSNLLNLTWAVGVTTSYGRHNSYLLPLLGAHFEVSKRIKLTLLFPQKAEIVWKSRLLGHYTLFVRNEQRAYAISHRTFDTWKSRALTTGVQYKRKLLLIPKSYLSFELSCRNKARLTLKSREEALSIEHQLRSKRLFSLELGFEG